MLENIRESSQGLVAKIILGFIILTFAVAGIGSYTNSADTSVAEVNGVKISQADFEKALQNQRNRMAQQFGEMFETLASDPSYMANMRESVLNGLIDQELLLQASDGMAIRVSDELIKKTIREMQEFQVDGKFDNNRYLALINQAGFYQSTDFRDYLRTQMVRQQLTQGLVASEFSLPYQEKQLANLQNQKRDLRFATISSKQFEEGIEVSEEDIKSYYQENQSRFQNEEKVKLDFIAIDVNKIAASIEVSDADIETYYNDNIANFKREEQRRVSHILVETLDDADAAKAKMKTIQDRLAAGEEFAALAQELSDDTFSGENGGDLEWLERGAMEDDAFDEAAFALAKVGDVSDVVETEFGLHLIKLTELTEEEVQTLAEVKDQLKETVSNEKAQDKFFELQQQVAELSFEVPDSLEDAANAIGESVQTSAWISRNGGIAPFDNPKVLDAAFSDMVITEQLNSDVIEVNNGLAVVVRINEYQEANAKPLAEVSEEIKANLVSTRASEKAQTVADELLTAFTAGENIEQQLADSGAAFEEHKDIARFGHGLDGSLVRDAFTLPHPVEGQVSAKTVSLMNGDLALVEVTAIKSDEEAAIPAGMGQQVTQLIAQNAFEGYISSLKADAKITRRNLTAAN